MKKSEPARQFQTQSIKINIFLLLAPNPRIVRREKCQRFHSIRCGLMGVEAKFMSSIFEFQKLIRRIADPKLLVFSGIRSRFVFSASNLVPSHEHISHLILQQKSANQAVQTFEWASKIHGFTHSPSTYRALIHKLCNFRQFKVVEQLLDEMPKTVGSSPDDDIFITVVRGFARARMIREAIRVLDMVAKFQKGAPSVKLMNSILDVLVKADIDIAREFYRKKMMGNGVKGDDYTYGILMKGFCLTNRIGDGFKLLQVMKTHGIKVNAVVYNTLIYALCKNGKVGRARSLMNEMKEFSNVTFDILISTYCNENRVVQALVMIEKCFSNGFLPNIAAVTKVVDVLGNAGRFSEAVEVLERVESKGGTLDVVAYNTLLKGFVKAGKVTAGHLFLKQMEMKGCLPTTDTYNVLIRGFCESKALDSALDMFHQMKQVGVKWNHDTFETLIYGLCSVGRTRDGIKIFAVMFEYDMVASTCRISPYNSILYGLYKENRLDQALEFLNYMTRFFPRAVDRSMRILESCREGRVDEAKQTLDKMRQEGDCPSAIVYGKLIEGLSKKGFMKEAVEVMNEMIGFGYFPVSLTCNALISGFIGQGEVQSAVRLMNDLKIRGCLLDSESSGLIIKQLFSQVAMQQAVMLFTEIMEMGVKPDSCTWNALILGILQAKNLSSEHQLLLQGLSVA